MEARGIRSVPTVFVGDQVITGYDSRKLQGLLGLQTGAAGRGDRLWLSARYTRVLGNAISTVRYLPAEHMEVTIPQRRSTMRGQFLHIFSAANGAQRSHVTGTFTQADLGESSREETSGLTTPAQVAAYGEKVLANITGLLRAYDTRPLERVVDSYYGGRTTVLEVLHIMLGHSAHHLRQAHWFMGEGLKLQVADPLTAEDMQGVIMPNELF